jgi:small subunit ribosomal protein S4
MARYTGPVCRLCRRERMKLFLKGPKCDTMKCPIERSPTRRASTAAVASARASTCSSCARSRRRAASTACSRSSSATSTRGRPPAGHHRREPAAHARAALDNVVFRAGFAASRNQARQFVRHGHVPSTASA